jgi:glycosyltransferase involved in cell wall biosynthesis
MSKSAPLVSICIPTYCGARHIAAAIDSVLNQTFTNFELLIVDDDSSDNTLAEVVKFSDSRIRVLKNKDNIGAQGNWNRCLDEARGKYIKLLPQDDSLASSCVEQQVEIFERDTMRKIELVFCARTIVNSKNKPVLLRAYSILGSGVIHAESIVRSCVRRGTNLIGEPGAVLFRAETARAIGGFDANIPYVIDLDYWFRLLLKGDAYYFSDPLSSFRISEASWSVRIGARQSKDYRLFIKKIMSVGEFAIGRFDNISGVMMATLNNFARLALYRWILHG